MKHLTLVILTTVLSAEAYGWRGDGTRQGIGANKIPVDITHAMKSQTGITADIRVEFSNQKNYTDTFSCDSYGEIKAVLGSSYALIRAYLDKRLVEPGMGFEQHFVFRNEVLGDGYKLEKDSQYYELACLALDPGETPDYIPTPSDFCDPEFTDCDFTCQAGEDPNQCIHPSQDWEIGF